MVIEVWQPIEGYQDLYVWDIENDVLEIFDDGWSHEPMEIKMNGLVYLIPLMDRKIFRLRKTITSPEHLKHYAPHWYERWMKRQSAI